MKVSKTVKGLQRQLGWGMREGIRSMYSVYYCEFFSNNLDGNVKKKLAYEKRKQEKKK